MPGARQYISVVYKSAMGGTDMERHRRGWKGNPSQEARRFLRFISRGEEISPSFLPSLSAFDPPIIVPFFSFLRAPLYAFF